MIISHWGIFPGFWYQSNPMLRNGGEAIWAPTSWEAWCAFAYGTGELAP